MEAPLVSVCMITYNHAPYIAEAIEGVMMQKCNFQFELIIGEDCSTDDTRTIVLQYKEKFPNKIRLLLREENLGMERNFIETMQATKGKYIALCEGDDYWTDSYKLQKQVDFLEKNPDVGLVAHRLKVFNQNSGIFSEDWLGYLFENGNDEYEITLSEYFRIWANHPCTVMFRTSMYDMEDAKYFTYYRDVHVFFNILLHGRLVCFSDCAAVYRIHNGGVWSMETAIRQNELDLKVYRELYNKYNTTFLKEMYNCQLIKYARYVIKDEHESNKMYELFDELRKNKLNKQAYCLYLLFFVKKIIGRKMFRFIDKVYRIMFN